jgi:hypothetical protein
MAVPALGDALRRVARVAELEAPHAVDLDRGHRKLGFEASALEVLDQGHAIKDEGTRQADGVDAAPLARAIDARRARAKRVDHEA